MNSSTSLIQYLLDIDCNVTFTKFEGRLTCTVYNPINSVIWFAENKSYYKALEEASQKFKASDEYKELTKFIDMTPEEATEFLMFDKNQIEPQPILVSDDRISYSGWKGARSIMEESKQKKYKHKKRSFSLASATKTKRKGA